MRDIAVKVSPMYKLWPSPLRTVHVHAQLAIDTPLMYMLPLCEPTTTRIGHLIREVFSDDTSAKFHIYISFFQDGLLPRVQVL